MWMLTVIVFLFVIAMGCLGTYIILEFNDLNEISKNLNKDKKMILSDGTEVEYDIQNKLLFIYQNDEDENEQVIYLDIQSVNDLISYLNTIYKPKGY